MSASADILPRRLLSVSDYHRMGETGILAPDERVELIEGEIIAMPPIGPAHNGLVNRLIRLLDRAVGDRAIVQAQGPVRLSDLSEPEPDLALLRPRDDFYTTRIPRAHDTLLLIEVADATLNKDRTVKIPLYARHAVPEVWLVDVAGERVVAYREPGDGGYAREVEQHPPERLEPLSLEGVTIDLSSLFDTA